jgi:hypothetical protein
LIGWNHDSQVSSYLQLTLRRGLVTITLPNRLLATIRVHLSHPRYGRMTLGVRLIRLNAVTREGANT